MRGLFDLSRTLVAISFILTGLGFFKILGFVIEYIKLCQIDNCIIVPIIQTLVFIILGIIFFKRAEKIMKYKVRMLMQVYDICMENEKENTVNKKGIFRLFQKQPSNL